MGGVGLLEVFLVTIQNLLTVLAFASCSRPQRMIQQRRRLLSMSKIGLAFDFTLWDYKLFEFYHWSEFH